MIDLKGNYARREKRVRVAGNALNVRLREGDHGLNADGIAYFRFLKARGLRLHDSSLPTVILVCQIAQDMAMLENAIRETGGAVIGDEVSKIFVQKNRMRNELARLLGRLGYTELDRNALVDSSGVQDIDASSKYEGGRLLEGASDG